MSKHCQESPFSAPFSKSYGHVFYLAGVYDELLLVRPGEDSNLTDYWYLTLRPALLFIELIHHCSRRLDNLQATRRVGVTTDGDGVVLDRELHGASVDCCY